MKGRIHDPELRRFLTPDPVVQDPLSGQSHNRYSGAANNPATRTDPTGPYEQEYTEDVRGTREILESSWAVAVAGLLRTSEAATVPGAITARSRVAM